jgi:hypothetical protein
MMALTPIIGQSSLDEAHSDGPATRYEFNQLQLPPQFER